MHSKLYAVVFFNYCVGYKGVDKAYESLVSHIYGQVETNQEFKFDDSAERTIPRSTAGLMEANYGNIRKEEPGHYVKPKNEL